jgi:hypothetical protein
MAGDARAQPQQQPTGGDKQQQGNGREEERLCP